jgi:gliding motility-associated-like protein
MLLGACLALFSSRVLGQCTINKEYAKTYSLEVTSPNTKSYPPNAILNQQSIVQLPDRGIITGGPVYNKFLLLKTNLNGDRVWSKQYSASSNEYPGSYTQSVLDKDGSLACAFENTYLAKVDTAGNVLSTVQMVKRTGNFIFYDIRVLENGDKVVLCVDQNSSQNSYILTRISADLRQVVWTKYFSVPEGYYKNLLIDGDKILMSGFISLNKVSILCFSAFDGALISQSHFNVANRRNTVVDIFKYNGGYVVQGYLFLDGDAPLEDNNIIVRLGPDLTPIKALKFVNIDRHYNLTLKVEPDGGLYGAFGWKNVNLMQVSKDDNVLWARTHYAIPTSTPAHLLKDNSGIIVAGGDVTLEASTGKYSWYYSLTKSDLNGTFLNCTYKDTPVSTLPLSFTQVDYTVTAKDTSLFSISDATTSVENLPLSETTICKATFTCNELKINGPLAVCDTGFIKFTGKRSEGCILPVGWSVLGDSVQSESLNDSTFSIKFPGSGTYTVVARLAESCDKITDTLVVKVSFLQSKLSLGSDTTLCPGSSITLNAHSGFTSYLWEDNTTDSTRQVNQSGTYSVATTDACGNIYKDTVVVKVAADIAFDLGPDLLKCNTDSLKITAPSGFISYSWSPAYNISSTSAQSVNVNPPQATTYRVVAQTAQGCKAEDSVKVTVDYSPPINLGPDTSFCKGDSLVLDAGTGFSSYLWNNDLKTEAITVKTKGVYSVIGVTQAGCRSFDTLQVINVFDKPIVKLSNDTGLCAGDNKVLDAGSGYKSYLWNNGSTKQTLKVNSINTYWVKVTDGNGCVGGDTVTISKVYPLPKDFLPRDTAICLDSAFRLTSLRVFSSYLWSTGENVKSILITQPGIYGLTVKDNNGCAGTSSVTVAMKQCAKGVYIPNAFTPNRDGKNDTFRPLLFGKVITYHLAIYNRWGEKIFESTEPNVGWDGTTNGRDANTSVYIWTCIYQLEGSPIKSEKGTVILVR